MMIIKKLGRKLKPLVIPVTLSSFLSALVTFYACSTVSVKLFTHDPDRGGIYRKQSNELIPWSDPRIKEYLAIHNEDWRLVREYCKLPASIAASNYVSQDDTQFAVQKQPMKE